eukprot:TRINITY_DN6175_c0_g1_i1.p1 TRINITY_DN6175_c0_g1~~TRINITY_DN6175_c0_g1_i1.p1  ORF type:complete len:142 (+),score=22.92 TRINITY_DN6175_c0_g1_i1:144-569(+)
MKRNYHKKTKEIKHLEIKLDAERSKCELLSMQNTKLQKQLSIKSDNNECNEGLMCNMSTVIDYLKRRVSQQELELKKYKQTEYEESSNITIDLGVSELEADIVGLSIFFLLQEKERVNRYNWSIFGQWIIVMIFSCDTTYY